MSFRNDFRNLSVQYLFWPDNIPSPYPTLAELGEVKTIIKKNEKILVSKAAAKFSSLALI